MTEPLRVRGGRLAIVLTGLGLGGVQRTMLTLAGGLLERGVEVDLVVPRAEGPFLEAVPEGARLVALGSRLARLPWIRSRKRRRSLASTGALAAYLRGERPVLALAASHYVNLSLVWARRRAGVPVRVAISQRTALSRAIENAGFPFRRRPLLQAMVRRGYPMADAITAVSDGVAEDLARVSGIPRDSIATLPNPLRMEEVELGAAAPVPHPWLSDDAVPVCVALGRLAPQKDLPTLLRAMVQVRRRRPVRLLVLGEGRERARLEQMVEELDLAEDVALPGYVENPFAWLARARLFILSSSYEGLPGALVQALACGCPVVSTDCPSGPREILEEGKLGALVPVGDPTAMAGAIDAALETPPDRAPLRRRALDFAREPVVDAWLAWLEGVAA
ncbi:MAG: glycosyltransferase [Planctomycetota bacterium]|nr:glycosyl transferase [Deltaproteobacteria bacterium]MDP6540836.1 glycosyltransferase [Planctomycetota bacterium]